MPAPDWNGDISFTVVGYKAVEAGNNDLGLAYHNLPRSVKNALDEVRCLSNFIVHYFY